MNKTAGLGQSDLQQYHGGLAESKPSPYQVEECVVEQAPLLFNLISELSYQIAEISYQRVHISEKLHNIVNTRVPEKPSDPQKDHEPNSVKDKLEYLIRVATKIREGLMEDCKKLSEIV